MRKVANTIETADKTFKSQHERDRYIATLMIPGYGGRGLLKGEGTCFFDCDQGVTGMQELISESDAWMIGGHIIMDRYDMTTALPTAYTTLGLGLGTYRGYKLGTVTSDGILHFDDQIETMHSKSMGLRLGNLYIRKMPTRPAEALASCS